MKHRTRGLIRYRSCKFPAEYGLRKIKRPHTPLSLSLLPLGVETLNA